MTRWAINFLIQCNDNRYYIDINNNLLVVLDDAARDAHLHLHPLPVGPRQGPRREHRPVEEVHPRRRARLNPSRRRAVEPGQGGGGEPGEREQGGGVGAGDHVEGADAGAWRATSLAIEIRVGDGTAQTRPRQKMLGLFVENAWIVCGESLWRRGWRPCGRG